MKLDIRMPMGVMFVVLGLILREFGQITNNDPSVYSRSLGANIDWIWGDVLLFFGVVMVVLARRAMKSSSK
jgi:multisubunit Na+/H+ antiporter MnhG subunit